MSLINDALKQARQSQPNNPPSGSPPLPPVEPPPRGGVSGFLLILIVLFLVTAAFFVGLSLSRPKPLPISSAPKHSLKRHVEPVSKAVPVVTNALAVSNAAVATPPPPPEPKLQGILFEPTRPCAIVDGVTVFVGDRVSGFRVMAISKYSVTLKSDAETKVLNLSQ